ncbi:MAG TPA: hypothetical protein VE669_10945, partial [Actinomycetota bacterium]|nr:hypothetical protein [Actinomycetota bacterium]
ERQRDVRYDDAGLDSLARQAAERTTAGDNAGEESALGSVLDCLRTSGAPIDEPADVLVRLIEARYLDTSAYLAVFLEGPGAGQPPNHAVVWVAAVDDCRFLSAASRKI